ncbi:DUF6344 domain-containing protein [Streptomyces sp. NPDC002491]
MTDNRVMKLWTAIVTAFLALCTALGLITAAAATAAAATEPARSAESFGAAQEPARPTASSSTTWLWSQTRSLPPTMKQRISAEAHGKSPSCRHHGLPDTEAAEYTTSCTPEDPAEPAALQQN